MKKLTKTLLFGGLLMGFVLFSSCNSKKSVQAYWLEKSQSPNYTSLTVPASLLNIAVDSLEKDQRAAVKSLSKFNVLLYKTPEGDDGSFAKEKSELTAVIKGSTYKELMNINSPEVKGAVLFLGREDAIDEFLAYGSRDANGFILIRIIGDNMSPKHIKPFVNAMKQSHVNSEEIEALFSALK